MHSLRILAASITLAAVAVAQDDAARAASADEVRSSDVSHGLEISVGFETHDDLGAGSADATTMLQAMEDVFAGAKEPIYSSGQTLASWKSCAQDDAAPGDCYQMGKHLDRLYFNVEWPVASSDLFLFEAPTASVYGSDKMEVKVLKYSIAAEEGSGSFMVMINCRNSPGERARIIVDFVVAESQSVRFAWFKECGFGPHQFLELGFFPDREQYGTRLSNGNNQSSESLPIDNRAFGPSSFYIVMHKPALFQEYLRPTLDVSSDKVRVMVRGADNGGLVTLSHPATMSMMYECKENATVEVTMTVPIPPFLPLVGRWRKQCVMNANAGPSKSLKLTLDNDLRSSVYSDGAVAPEFKAESKSLWKLGAADRLVIATLENVGRVDMTIGSVSVSPANPRSVHLALLECDVLGCGSGSALSTREEVVLGPGEVARVGFRMVCKETADTEIQGYIPVFGYQPIEFGMQKTCHAPKVRRRRAYITAGRYLFLVVGLCLLITFATLYIAYSRSSLQKAAKVFEPAAAAGTQRPSYSTPSITRV